MPDTYRSAIFAGWHLPPRGDRINVWAAPLNSYADRLDEIELPPEAVVILRELFEEIGHLLSEAAHV